MKILWKLLLVLYESSDLFDLLFTALFIAGVWLIFQKSGVKGWWACVPVARDHMMGKVAGRALEGRVAAFMTVVMLCLDIPALFIAGGDQTGERLDSLVLFLDALSVGCLLIRMIYKTRIMIGLCEVYGKKKSWVFLWIMPVFNVIPALVWGLNRKYQPVLKVDEIEQESLDTISGRDVQVMNEGLTVNLEQRTVREFFQKKVLLRDVHMNIHPGHMVLLLGGSGAGKTTFLNAVNGYEKARAKVVLNGGDLYADYKKMQYSVGFVPQQELMRGKDTVLHTLLDASLLRLPTNVSNADRKARVNEVMEIFGLTPVRDNLVEKLSGGQKKRLSIAMEFISNPSLFILDEPDSGLDGVMARKLMTQLREIADQGKIVIVITHTPDRVIDLFDDVIVLAKDTHRTGRLAVFGSLDEARRFFGKDKMEEIVLSINRKEEGGEGRADEYISKYTEAQYG